MGREVDQSFGVPPGRIARVRPARGGRATDANVQPTAGESRGNRGSAESLEPGAGRRNSRQLAAGSGRTGEWRHVAGGSTLVVVARKAPETESACVGGLPPAGPHLLLDRGPQPALLEFQQDKGEAGDERDGRQKEPAEFQHESRLHWTLAVRAWGGLRVPIRDHVPGSPGLSDAPPSDRPHDGSQERGSSTPIAAADTTASGCASLHHPRGLRAIPIGLPRLSAPPDRSAMAVSSRKCVREWGGVRRPNVVRPPGAQVVTRESYPPAEHDSTRRPRSGYASHGSKRVRGRRTARPGWQTGQTRCDGSRLGKILPHWMQGRCAAPRVDRGEGRVSGCMGMPPSAVGPVTPFRGRFPDRPQGHSFEEQDSFPDP